jgi:hypothetical protein
VEILEVFVVHSYFYSVFGSQEERAATFESEYDGGQFLVVGIIVSFSIQKGATVEGDRVDPIVEVLGNNCS